MIQIRVLSMRDLFCFIHVIAVYVNTYAHIHVQKRDP